MPPGLNANGHVGATLSPDRTLLLTASVPPGAVDVPSQYDQLVLSAVDGTLVLNLGVLEPRRSGLDRRRPAGHRRLVGAGLRRSDASIRRPHARARRSGRSILPAGTPAGTRAERSWWVSSCRCRDRTSRPALRRCCVDVDTGRTSPPGPVVSGNTFALGVAVFAQSADGRQAAIADGAALELGAVAGGARPQLGTASRAIVGVGLGAPDRRDGQPGRAAAAAPDQRPVSPGRRASGAAPAAAIAAPASG